ncbi:MAG: hypothetical protein ACK4HB_01255 [Candidatus Bipolaricaulia bacterium]
MRGRGGVSRGEGLRDNVCAAHVSALPNTPMYIDDPATRSKVEMKLRELEQLAQQGRYEEFKDSFVDLIFQYMTWRRSPQP